MKLADSLILAPSTIICKIFLEEEACNQLHSNIEILMEILKAWSI